MRDAPRTAAAAAPPCLVIRDRCRRRSAPAAAAPRGAPAALLPSLLPLPFPSLLPFFPLPFFPFSPFFLPLLPFPALPTRHAGSPAPNSALLFTSRRRGRPGGGGEGVRGKGKGGTDTRGAPAGHAGHDRPRTAPRSSAQQPRTAPGRPRCAGSLGSCAQFWGGHPPHASRTPPANLFRGAGAPLPPPLSRPRDSAQLLRPPRAPFAGSCGRERGDPGGGPRGAPGVARPRSAARPPPCPLPAAGR